MEQHPRPGLDIGTNPDGQIREVLQAIGPRLGVRQRSICLHDVEWRRWQRWCCSEIPMEDVLRIAADN